MARAKQGQIFRNVAELKGQAVPVHSGNWM